MRVLVYLDLFVNSLEIFFSLLKMCLRLDVNKYVS